MTFKLGTFGQQLPAVLWFALLTACGVPAAELPTPAPPPIESVPAADTAEPKPTWPQFDPAGLSEGPGSGFIVLDNPAVVPGSSADWLSPDELVLGVVVGDQARAYPISQMAYHHIANDQIDGEPYLVTY